MKNKLTVVRNLTSFESFSWPFTVKLSTPPYIIRKLRLCYCTERRSITPLTILISDHVDWAVSRIREKSLCIYMWLPISHRQIETFLYIMGAWHVSTELWPGKMHPKFLTCTTLILTFTTVGTLAKENACSHMPDDDTCHDTTEFKLISSPQSCTMYTQIWEGDNPHNRTVLLVDLKQMADGHSLVSRTTTWDVVALWQQ